MTRGDIESSVLYRMNRVGDTEAAQIITYAYNIAFREIQGKSVHLRNLQGVKRFPFSGISRQDQLVYDTGADEVREIIRTSVEQLVGSTYNLVKYYTQTNYETLKSKVASEAILDAGLYAIFNNIFYVWPWFPTDWLGKSDFFFTVEYYSWINPGTDPTTTDYLTTSAWDYLTYRVMREVCLDFGMSKDYETRLRDREDEAARRFAAFETKFFNTYPTRVAGGTY